MVFNASLKKKFSYMYFVYTCTCSVGRVMFWHRPSEKQNSFRTINLICA